MSNAVHDQVANRRTFAIISHPDAGKTTMTEKLLLLGQLIQVAGTVKGRGSDRHATSDWMSMEQERGISITSSVMQFPFRERIVNLLDTPGHEDFSEDTYRTLTAVDSALMVVDGAKGVEARTIKLMDVCRLRDTPIFSFVNKLDREIRDPIDLLDEIESVLKIEAAPLTGLSVRVSASKGSTTFTRIRFICSQKDRDIFWLSRRSFKGWTAMKLVSCWVQIMKSSVTKSNWFKALLISGTKSPTWRAP